MKSTTFASVTITALSGFFAQPVAAGGFLNAAGKAASLVMTGVEIADEFNKRSPDDTKPIAVVTWYDNGAAFGVSKLPESILTAVDTWNSIPEPAKSGLEQLFGKIKRNGPGSVYAWDYPETAWELRTKYLDFQTPEYANATEY
ncbi:hypothetical protein B0T10DRAFT_567997 [Thelonectria olida]|nr:hypothetical protein B0T10DRAFT_567997 [Thelonectria olida]